MNTHTITIKKQLDGYRLDIAILDANLGLSRRKIRSIIDVGGVFLNGKRVRVASRSVRLGDVIKMQYNLNALKAYKHIEFNLTDADILYRGHGIIAINKPPGLPSQPTRDQAVIHVTKALENYLKAKNEKIPDLTLVHRLDKETSGVLLVATTKEATAWLNEQFKERHTDKTYHAVCYGAPKDDKFTVRCHLSAINPRSGIVSVVRSGGKSSHTDFVVLQRSKKPALSLIECHPITGRSHQLRVHLQHVGHAIVGDKVYEARGQAPLTGEIADLAAQHHFLHAHTLTFQPAANQPRVTVTCKYPPAMERFITHALAAYHGDKLHQTTEKL